MVKRVAVTANNTYQEIMSAVLNEPDQVLVVCHVSPDGDAVGAALSMAHFLEQAGKSFTVVNDDPVPSRYDFMPGVERFQRTDSVDRQFRTIVAVDCADLKRLGTTTQLFADSHLLINIDHHETNNRYGHMNLVQAEASATCLVLYRMFHASGIAVDRNMAILLYTGILFDTGGFRYNNTTPEIHHAAADLLSRGFEPFMIADRVLESMTREQVELVRLGLSTLRIHDSGRIAYVVVSQELLRTSGASDDDTEVLLPYTRSLSGIEVGMLFRERPDGSVKVSLRSRDRVDVASIALRFGGGGHVRAAGCNLDGPIEQAVEHLVTAVAEAVTSAFS